MKIINLSYNLLNSIDERTFCGLVSLQKVNLSFNQELRVPGGREYFKDSDNVVFLLDEQMEEREKLTFASVDVKNFQMASNF